MNEESEVGRELAGLRKEVYEARNLIIKTDNLLKTFHAELKAVSIKQDRFEKRHFMGHVAAYVVIGVLAAGGAILYARSAGSAARQEAEMLLTQAREAEERARAAEEEATSTLAVRDAQADTALEAWRLLNAEGAERQMQGLERMSELDRARLSPFAAAVLDQAEGDVRQQLAESAYQGGMASYRRGDIAQSVDTLQTFLELAQGLPEDWSAEERKLAMYYLGAGANQLGRHDDAVEALQRFVQTPGARTTRAYAYLLLGDSLQMLGRVADARQAFQGGLDVDPNGQHTRALRRRLADLPG